MILAKQFFETARERYEIRLRREVDHLPAPWTTDPVFQSWRFCNVFREHDKTTRWFAKNVRGPLSEEYVGFDIFLVHATIAFRWFNRIETGKIIQDLLVKEWNSKEAKRRLRDVSPVVTGAYIVWSTLGMPKLDGVLHCIDRCRETVPGLIGPWASRDDVTLQEAWLALCNVMGPFMAYEVVSDLRWTPVLSSAPDINSWANAGPGCTRGLGRVVAKDADHFRAGSKADQATMTSYMKELLEMSRDSEYWPQHWRTWEMREVEHWCCEFDKYRRASAGQRQKRSFNGV